jgi:mutator protein MutT
MKQVDVAIAVVARGVDVLICRRPDGVPFAGYWEFPGGKREPDETLEQCVVRELREEVGATVVAESALTPIDHDYPHARVRLHAFICRVVDGDPRPIQCSACRWVAAVELRTVQFPPANEALVEEILTRFASSASPTTRPTRG